MLSLVEPERARDGMGCVLQGIELVYLKGCLSTSVHSSIYPSTSANLTSQAALPIF